MSLLHSNIIGDSGKELLVLHGFLGMSDNWKSQAKNFVAKGYRVHLIDQRNHGRSFWSDQFSYGELSDGFVQLYPTSQFEISDFVRAFYGGKNGHEFCSSPP